MLEKFLNPRVFEQNTVLTEKFRRRNEASNLFTIDFFLATKGNCHQYYH